MEKRYQVLRIMSTIYKVVGIIVAVLTLLSAISFCGASVLGGSAMENVFRNLPGGAQGPGQGAGLLGGLVGGVLASLIIIIGGGIYALTIYALGELVSLLVAMEENTRHTAVLLLHEQREHHEQHELPAAPAAPPPVIPPPAGG